MDKLTAKDIQDFQLGFHAESYIQEQQMNDVENGGMRSSRNSQSYQDYKQNMEDKFGGIE